MKDKLKEGNISTRLKKMNIKSYRRKTVTNNKKENNREIMLIALVITIVLNCSFLAMV